MPHGTMLECEVEDGLVGGSERVKSFHDRDEKFYFLLLPLLG